MKEINGVKQPEVGDIFYSHSHKMQLRVTFKKYGNYWGLWDSGQTFSFFQLEDFSDFIYLGVCAKSMTSAFVVKRQK